MFRNNNLEPQRIESSEREKKNQNTEIGLHPMKAAAPTSSEGGGNWLPLSPHPTGPPCEGVPRGIGRGGVRPDFRAALSGTRPPTERALEPLIEWVLVPPELIWVLDPPKTDLVFTKVLVFLPLPKN